MYSNVVQQFIDKTYNPDNLPDGPYFVLSSVFGISDDYYVIVNGNELCDFLNLTEDYDWFNNAYFHLNQCQDHLDIIYNMIVFGYDLFNWWTVKKEVLDNIESPLGFHKSYWINVATDYSINTYYNQYIDRLLSNIVINETNGEIKTIEKFLNVFNDSFNLYCDDSTMFNQLCNLIINHEMVYWNIYELIDDLKEMLYYYVNCEQQSDGLIALKK